MSGEMIALLATLAATLVLSAILMLRAMLREERVAERLLAVQRSVGFAEAKPKRSARRVVIDAVSAVGRALAGSGLLSHRTVAELEQTLAAAGFRGDRALWLFIGAKLILFLSLPAMAWVGLGWSGVTPSARLLLTAAAAVAGLLLPDAIARQLRRRYLAELERGLPDALDMMVICAEAGLGIETAIDRVAQEIGAANRPVALEFGLTSSELRILSDRRQALINLGERTRLDSLRRFSTTLLQTIQYGTPLSLALRTLAAEMRQEALVRYEARAARLPVLLTMPMILFILPTVFLVIAGPAAIGVLRLK